MSPLVRPVQSSRRQGNGQRSGIYSFEKFVSGRVAEAARTTLETDDPGHLLVLPDPPRTLQGTRILGFCTEFPKALSGRVRPSEPRTKEADAWGRKEPHPFEFFYSQVVTAEVHVLNQQPPNLRALGKVSLQIRSESLHRATGQETGVYCEEGRRLVRLQVGPAAPYGLTS